MAGVFAGTPAKGPEVQGDAEWVGYMYVVWLRPVRDGGIAVGCGRGAGWRKRLNLPSATRPRPREALAGPCRWGGEAGPAGAAHVGPCRGRT